MRENRQYGSEGGGTELNRSSLPLSQYPIIRSSGRGCLFIKLQQADRVDVDGQLDPVRGGRVGATVCQQRLERPRRDAA